MAGFFLVHGCARRAETGILPLAGAAPRCPNPSGASPIVTPHFIRQLAAAGACAPSADNSQPWRMRWDGRALSLCYAERHAGPGVFGPSSHATLLSVGAVLENLHDALTANGAIAPPRERWGDGVTEPYAAFELAAPQHEFTIPARLTGRHTNRLPYRATAVPAALAEEVGRRRAGGNRIALLTDPQRKARLVRLVKACSEARFCNRDLHAWLYGSLRHTPEAVARGDGLDMRTLGLPPGGKQLMGFMADWRRMVFLNRLGAYKLLAQSETGLIAAAPALLCIIGPADRGSVIEAGGLLAGVWSDLNAQGLAVQPYYVVTDQLNRLHDGTLAPGFEGRIGAAEAELRALLELRDGEQLHMILRVGYPKSEPVRSARLPLEAVLVDAST